MHSDADYQKLSEQLPVVLFDRFPSDSALPLVMTDSVTPTAELISRIAPQHADEFWFLGGQPRLSPSRDRLAGFTQGPARAGITLRPEWVINGNYHPSSGYEMFAALCARLGRPPKALFTAACGLLEGVLRYMSQHHLLDSNIHLASFDDHYLYDSLSLRIDTVQQDNRQLASALLRSAQPADRRSGPGAASALPARHPADSPSLTARLAISVFASARAACLSASSALASTRQGRSLPASGKPPATRAIHHPAPASPDSSPPAPRCRSAPGLTSFDAGRMAEWSGSGCRTAGLHLSRELRLHLGQHAGRQRVRCRQQMPVAIHQQQLIMPLLGRGSGERRASPPAAGRFPLRRRNVHPPLKAFRHPLRILLQLADLPLTENLSGRQIHAPTERRGSPAPRAA